MMHVTWLLCYSDGDVEVLVAISSSSAVTYYENVGGTGSAVFSSSPATVDTTVKGVQHFVVADVR